MDSQIYLEDDHLYMPLTQVRVAQPSVCTIPAEEDTRLLWLDPSLGPQPSSLQYRVEDFPYLHNAPPVVNLALEPTRELYADVTVKEVTYPRMLEILPLELREKIWEYYFAHFSWHYCKPSLKVDIHRYAAGVSPVGFLLDICFMSRQTRDDILAVYIRHARFDIESSSDVPYFRRFIESIPNGADHVRELFFKDFDKFPEYDKTSDEFTPTKPGLELAVACSDLRALRLRFETSFFTNVTWDSVLSMRVYPPDTHQKVAVTYQIQRLLDCKRLRKVVLEGMPECWPGLDYSFPVLNNLAT
ncbi:hypothetical protein CC86DRAFT_423059 [Ophiobolus disseminans]|uniref:Uncharacterized protein n=1 Tax=Ophiobolus disseminans TaxID=1469910 RepID=A0A6A6ZQB4_9PLEO|nr:hypothetical protein CC86DRAFT_423059 [Ophiobolus disseminans]